jgi:hypothetical protein
MEAKQIKEWILVASASVTLISVALGSWLTLAQYRVTLKTEERLKENSRIESDIRLVKAYNELAQTAAGRSGYILSEKTVEALLTNGTISKEDFKDLSSLNEKLKKAALIRLPVADIQGVAAVASIGTLATQHQVLRDIGKHSLTEFLLWQDEKARDLANSYLQKLKKLEGNQSN